MKSIPELSVEEHEGVFRAVLFIRRDEAPNTRFVSHGSSRQEALSRLLWLVRTMPDGNEELVRFVEGYTRSGGANRR